MPHPLYSDDFQPLHAHITVEGGPHEWSVVLESRGGTIGTNSERNAGYALGLRTVLMRLELLHSVLDDALVASRNMSEHTEADRRVKGLVFPISLTPASDVKPLAASLQRGQRGVGASQGAAGGNTTKRLLLRVDTPHALTMEAMVLLLTRAILTDAMHASMLAEAGSGLAAEGHFDPHGLADGRLRAMRSIADRHGQPAFRTALLKAYGHRCAITECTIVRLLDAAHIRPYNGATTNHVQNGLLLRTDIHTLFDLFLLGVDPVTRCVITHPDLMGTEYAALHGKLLRLPTEIETHPSWQALAMHLERVNLVADSAEHDQALSVPPAE